MSFRIVDVWIWSYLFRRLPKFEDMEHLLADFATFLDSRTPDSVLEAYVLSTTVINLSALFVLERLVKAGSSSKAYASTFELFLRMSSVIMGAAAASARKEITEARDRRSIRFLSTVKIIADWLRANVASLSSAFAGFDTTKTTQFWACLADFLNLFGHPNPESCRQSVALREDVELLGFLPLKTVHSELTFSTPAADPEIRLNAIIYDGYVLEFPNIKHVPNQSRARFTFASWTQASLESQPTGIPLQDSSTPADDQDDEEIIVFTGRQAPPSIKSTSAPAPIPLARTITPPLTSRRVDSGPSTAWNGFGSHLVVAQPDPVRQRSYFDFSSWSDPLDSSCSSALDEPNQSFGETGAGLVTEFQAPPMLGQVGTWASNPFSPQVPARLAGVHHPQFDTAEARWSSSVANSNDPLTGDFPEEPAWERVPTGSLGVFEFGSPEKRFLYDRA